MRKPRGYWLDIENVKKELIPLIDKYGRFPSNKEMIKEIGSSLPRYIMKYHGGIIKVSKELGVKTHDESIGRNHQGTWNKELVVNEFIKIINERNLNHFPSRYDFKNWGYNIYTGITQSFGNYKNFKTHLKQSGFILEKKEKNKKWNWENVVKKIEPIVQKNGYLSLNELDKMGLSGLRGYIQKNNLREKLISHFKTTTKPRKYSIPKESGYWLDIENIKTEVLQLHKKYGRVPTTRELVELGYGGLSGHINKLDNKTLEKIGYYSNSNLIKTKDGDYVRSVYELLFDNFLSFNKIKHSTEGQISNEIEKNYQYDFKLTLKNKVVVYVEVWGYSRDRDDRSKTYLKNKKRKENTYKSLNLNLIGINPEDYKGSLQNTYKIFTKKIKNFDQKFIPKKFNLNYFIYGSHYSIKTLMNELKIIIKENNWFFPSTDLLRKRKGGEGLISQIQKYGGSKYLQDKMGVSIKKKDPKWSIEFLKSELLSINELKFIPSYNDLENINRVDILGGIQKNGGVKKLSKLWNIPTKREYLKSQPKVYNGKWNQELIIDELKNIIKIDKEFPSEKKLKELGRTDLYIGIKRFGGIKNIKKIMGY